MLDARRLAFSHAWETEREDCSQLRARIIGGCSAHDACVVLAGAPADYDEWGHGWSYLALRPYLERAERELRVRSLTPQELSPWHAAFAPAAGEDAILHRSTRSAPSAGTRGSPTSIRRADART
jgi:choline dehydrogenase